MNTFSSKLRAAALSTTMLVTGGLVASPALADGQLSMKDAPAPFAATPTWGGFYAGGHVGGAFGDDVNRENLREKIEGRLREVARDLDGDGDDDHNDDGDDDDGDGDNDDGAPIAAALSDDIAEKLHRILDGGRGDTFYGGLHLGFLKEIGHRTPAVVGLKDDPMPVSDKRFLIGLEGNVDFREDSSVLYGLHARAGIANDNLFFYGLVGYAHLDLDEDDHELDDMEFAFANGGAGVDYNGIRVSADDGLDGYYLGLGAEFLASANLSIGAEAIYYDFGDQDYRVTDIQGSDDDIHHSEDLDFFALRLRASYKFGAKSPMAAPVPFK